MPQIILNTVINTPREVVFDLARSIDFHKESTKQTKEQAIAGKVKGLIELGESVTWRAKHFGFWLILESKITKFNYPNSFTDEMVKGSFKSFKHEHIFEIKDDKTVMTDIFDYKSPLGFLGKLADILFLKRYMTKFLSTRNTILKDYLESKNNYA
jgi:ligand-binding SRPBCC domain-containing protein